jgi:isoaspartyl peptidase/L-asparaginase-like protein (Ntn-hydrolase superfamily)
MNSKREEWLALTRDQTGNVNWTGAKRARLLELQAELEQDKRVLTNEEREEWLALTRDQTGNVNWTEAKRARFLKLQEFI